MDWLRRTAPVRRDKIVAALGLGSVIALTTWWFCALSDHIVAGTADSATVVLEGASINDGVWALHGWALSLDSFWSIDAQFYAFAIRMFGLRPELLHLVPALFASLLVVVAAFAAHDGRSGRGAVVAVGTVVCLLALPSPDLSYYLLNGPWHIATTLWCLIAFIGFTRATRTGCVVAVFFMATGALGDLLIVPFGLLPIAMSGLMAIRRQGSWRAGLRAFVTVTAAIASALLLRVLALTIGTFTLINRNVPIRFTQVTSNFSHLRTQLPGLLGVGSIPIKLVPHLSLSNGNDALQIAHVLGVVVVAACVSYVFIRTIAAMVARRRSNRLIAQESTLDDLLLLGLLSCLIVFVWAVPDDSSDYDKYLTAGIVFAVILCARTLATVRASNHARRVLGASVLAVGLVFGSVFALDSGLVLALRAPVQPAAKLARFLLSKGLTNGIGDYWSSSLVTVETAGKVTVRPIDTNAAGQIERFGRLSSADWYAHQHFSFLVFDLARPWHHVNATTAVANYGQPTSTYHVGTYDVLVWEHPLKVITKLKNTGSPLQVLIH